jgi:hypothetical protein
VNTISLLAYSSKYGRVSQEKRSIFWEVTVSVILRKKVYMKLCAKFKILHPKYRKLFRIGHMFISTFFLRLTDTVISQNIDLSSWDILYTE